MLASCRGGWAPGEPGRRLMRWAGRQGGSCMAAALAGARLLLPRVMADILSRPPESSRDGASLYGQPGLGGVALRPHPRSRTLTVHPHCTLATPSLHPRHTLAATRDTPCRLRPPSCDHHDLHLHTTPPPPWPRPQQSTASCPSPPSTSRNPPPSLRAARKPPSRASSSSAAACPPA